MISCARTSGPAQKQLSSRLGSPLSAMKRSQGSSKTIAVYDDFCHENDPWEEHDFGAFEVDGHKIFFKIDYYDPTLSYYSDDPADPTITHRMITIMLAEEY